MAIGFAAALVLSTAAHAQLFRAYLASGGNDANPCSLQQPCRLLPRALDAVASGGEIWMLDSANYNTAALSIGKSVSILAIPGAVGSVLAIGGPAISITAAGLNVALRNLAIAPLAGANGTSGVRMTGASTLTIANSLFANLPQQGVWVTGTGTARIVSTILQNNGGWAVALDGGAKGEIAGVQMLGNGAGGVLAASYGAVTTTAAVSDSVISGGGDGVWAYCDVAGAKAGITVTRSTIANADTALHTYGSDSSVSVSASTITNNAVGWYPTIGPILTLGNNHFTNNTTNYGSLTGTALQ